MLVCILGEDAVEDAGQEAQAPGPPMALATAPAHDPDLDKVIAAEVASELITRVAGKRLATVVRRIPVVGGSSGGADAYATWQIGRYAERELLARGAPLTATAAPAAAVDLERGAPSVGLRVADVWPGGRGRLRGRPGRAPRQLLVEPYLLAQLGRARWSRETDGVERGVAETGAGAGRRGRRTPRSSAAGQQVVQRADDV